MSKKYETKSQFLEVAKSGQNVYFQEILVLCERKIKIDIRTDSYKNQGHARAFVWDPASSQWNLVFHITPENMQSASNLAYIARKPVAADFAADYDTLLDQTVAILW